MRRRTRSGRRSAIRRLARAGHRPVTLSALVLALLVVVAISLWPELAPVLGVPPATGPGAGRPHAPGAASELGPGTRARVTRVVDGDTIEVQPTQSGGPVTIRVLGIDCPETRSNQKCVRDGRAGRLGCAQQVPLGRKAAARADELLSGAEITLECEGRCRKGSYGRALRYVHLEGIDFGLRMIREGLCSDYGGKYPHARRAEYAAVQAEVQRAGIGLWAIGKPL